MEQIIIEDRTYTIPTDWEGITIEKQLVVERLAKENPEYKSLAIVAGYCGLDLQQVKRMPINGVKRLLTELEFIKRPLPAVPVQEFEFKGETYTVMPTLLKSEFQDFLSLETVLQSYKENLYNALPTIVAILAKKEGESLDQIDIEVRAEHFKQLPLPIANSLYNFFLCSAMLSSADSRKILQAQDQEIQRLMLNMKSTLKIQSGGGLYMRLQKATLRSYLKSLERQWNRYYGGLPLKPEKQN